MANQHKDGQGFPKPARYWLAAPVFAFTTACGSLAAIGNPAGLLLRCQPLGEARRTTRSVELICTYSNVSQAAIVFSQMPRAAWYAYEQLPIQRSCVTNASGHVTVRAPGLCGGLLSWWRPEQQWTLEPSASVAETVVLKTPYSNPGTTCLVITVFSDYVVRFEGGPQIGVCTGSVGSAACYVPVPTGNSDEPK